MVPGSSVKVHRWHITGATPTGSESNHLLMKISLILCPARTPAPLGFIPRRHEEMKWRGAVPALWSAQQRRSDDAYGAGCAVASVGDARLVPCQVQRRTAPPVMPPSITSSAAVM